MRWLALLLAGPAFAAQPVTFTKDIAPILFEHCAPCHRPHEAAPFPLLAYEDARRHAAQIARVTERRYMPPWPPEPGVGDFAGSRRLTDAQIRLIAEWARNGAPEGNLADLPLQPHFPDGWQLGPPDLVLHMQQPYRLAADGSDVFRNFVIPVALRETKYIRAMELRPGDKRVVHHANLIVDRSRLLRRQDGKDGQPGFAGMDVATEVTGEFDPDSHFLFWKPGSPPEEEPAAMAWKLDPGSDLIVNLHLRPSGKPETVDVSVGLYFADRPPTQFPMLLQLEHDGAIDIPPGAARFAVTDRLKLPIAVDLLAIYPHAHFLGKRVEAWAELPGGGRRDLLRIDDWDINWQATYTYRKSVPLPEGTTVAMRIEYDNSAANVRNPGHPPRRVTSGNRSEDEMGHVWLQVLPRKAGDPDPRLLLQQALMLRRIEKYPADFEAHLNLGASLQAMERHADALPYLSQAMRIRPANATAHNNLAVSLLVEGKTDEAIRELRASLALDAGYQNARFNLARALAISNDASGALAECLAYLKAAPDDAQAHEFAGRIYAEMGKLPEALPHFRKAVELNPKDTDLGTNLGVALARAGDLPAAIAAFESVLRSDPGNQAAREYLARARAGLGRKQ
jgi:tetratricopeptide (TPR) repeat protein